MPALSYFTVIFTEILRLNIYIILMSNWELKMLRKRTKSISSSSLSFATKMLKT